MRISKPKEAAQNTREAKTIPGRITLELAAEIDKAVVLINSLEEYEILKNTKGYIPINKVVSLLLCKALAKRLGGECVYDSLSKNFSVESLPLSLRQVQLLRLESDLMESDFMGGV